MTVLLILITFILAIVIDVFIIHHPTKEKTVDKKNIFINDIFYSPKIGLTMRDGGNPIKDKPIKKDNK